jgi:hypothetical protein
MSNEKTTKPATKLSVNVKDLPAKKDIRGGKGTSTVTLPKAMKTRPIG